VKFDLEALMRRREYESRKPTLWHARPHSNSWGVEYRTWSHMTKAQQELTRKKLKQGA
jgi:hypothetical protein